MFTNVLIGVDGRQGGRDAIALAKQLAAPEANVTLAHIYGAILGRGGAQALPLEREESQRILERERADAALDARLVIRLAGPVGLGLHQVADELRADLIVVGSSRRALLGRALMGDAARAALNGAACAVAIAPRGYMHTEHRLRAVGVGYDGSPESKRALAAARELARRDRATVHALWVVSLQNVRDEKPAPADGPGTPELLVNRCLERPGTIDGVEGASVYGDPGEELSRLSDRVDLMVVGSRGYGPVGRLFHGSVSNYLFGHVSCPLLVLPRSARTQDKPDPPERSGEVPVATAI